MALREVVGEKQRFESNVDMLRGSGDFRGLLDQLMYS